MLNYEVGYSGLGNGCYCIQTSTEPLVARKMGKQADELLGWKLKIEATQETWFRKLGEKFGHLHIRIWEQTSQH